MKLVLIEWVDSHSGRGWQEIEQLKSASELLYCRSVGWVVSENKNTIVLVPHISGEKNVGIKLCGCGDISIPKRAVTKIRTLKP